MNEMDKSYIDIMEELSYMYRLLELFGPCNLGSYYGEITDTADELGVEVKHILNLTTYLIKQETIPFNEALLLVKEFIRRGFNPDLTEYSSLLLIEDILFIIPKKDNEPTRIIKRIK